MGAMASLSIAVSAIDREDARHDPRDNRAVDHEFERQRNETPKLADGDRRAKWRPCQSQSKRIRSPGARRGRRVFSACRKRQDKPWGGGFGWPVRAQPISAIQLGRCDGRRDRLGHRRLLWRDGLGHRRSRECRRFSHTWKSHRRDRIGWLGRQAWEWRNQTAPLSWQALALRQRSRLICGPRPRFSRQRWPRTSSVESSPDRALSPTNPSWSQTSLNGGWRPASPSSRRPCCRSHAAPTVTLAARCAQSSSW